VGVRGLLRRRLMDSRSEFGQNHQVSISNRSHCDQVIDIGKQAFILMLRYFLGAEK
jgi:hypothetical protein